jgi:mannan polymerase II complex MNN10 subunit
MIAPFKGVRMPTPGTVLPKLVVAILTFAILYHLHPLLPPQSLPSAQKPHLVPATLYEHGNLGPGESVDENWLQHGNKKQQVAIEKEEGGQVGNDDHDQDRASLNFDDEVPTDHPISHQSSIISVDITSPDYSKNFVSYGEPECLPAFNETMHQEAITRYVSCTQFAPFYPAETRRVAFATISTGKREEAYDRAIHSQMFHSAVHGTPTHVLCSTLSQGAWNKIAFLLHLLMNEMLKPPSSRLEWVMWTDRDALILDACRPLSSFLPPPTPEYADVHLITNEDAFGLNAGVFLFRINDWSISFFNAVLAYPYYRPDEDLLFAEQTAMWNVMRDDAWTNSTVRVPWYWFNAYPVEGGSTETFETGRDPGEYFRARKGDFIAHFAGHTERREEMPTWENMLRKMGNVWLGSVQRDVTGEVQDYWKDWARGTLSKGQISGEERR